MIKVLIADTNPFDREVLETQAERLFPKKIHCRMVENGRKAVDIAALWGADILLLDMQMPEINGIQTARQILSQRPECQVIFVTECRSFEHACEALKLGACDYLLKPVDPEELKPALARAMDRLEDQRLLRSAAPAAETWEEPLVVEKHSVLMEKVRNYLRHNYMLCNISLDSVSTILNLNASYFSTQFKRSFGVNFVDYLTELRIRAAEELLRDPVHSASEIAHMVGYESANYFARAFKKKTGMTPTQYRRRTTESMQQDEITKTGKK